MCIEYDKTPTEPADTYLSLCLRPLNASLFVRVGVGVGVGVTSIPLEAIQLHLRVPLGEHLFFTFLSHELHIIDLI